MSVRYQDAGVHLATSDQVTTRITERLKNGLFGGFFPASALKAYDAPVLVSSIDGIGTKVRLASRLSNVDGLGLDLVHHCVNDIAVHGAIPLFFLDYLAFHTLDPALVHSLVDSMAGACDALGIQLAGGETAEMPLVYPPGQFDVAGAIVGVVEQQEIVDGSAIQAGDVLIGLPSSGVHTNGFSLIQKLFNDGDYGRHEPGLGSTLGEALLQPHHCYLSQIRALLASGTVHGLAHITGGGIAGNLSRIIPAGLEAVVSLPLQPPPLFALIEARGAPHDEMLHVFNMGIGLIAVCDPSLLSQSELSYPTIGTIQPTTNINRRVTFRDSA